MNDTAADIDALIEAIGRIRPTRVQLNTVARPPYESYAEPIDSLRMQEVKEQIEETYDGPVDVLAGIDEDGAAMQASDRRPLQDTPDGSAEQQEIINLLQRRPCTAADIAKTINLGKKNVTDILADMKKKGNIKQQIHGGKKYYRALLLQEKKI
jgi:wyosine [tRNA(Phe)-imidazoG37] synthetase (radical SAM superfamily)